MIEQKWTKGLPITPGSYWFYGWRFGDKESKPELSYVEVWKVQNGFAYVLRGHFLDERKAIGMWLKCELPQLPNYG